MKFLIINTPTAQETSSEYSIQAMRSHFERIKGFLHFGAIEKIWVLYTGGHAFVISAESFEELSRKLRNNPFSRVSHTKIIPIMDAMDFLDGVSTGTIESRINQDGKRD